MAKFADEVTSLGITLLNNDERATKLEIFFF